jgi:hypothetical protein
MLDIVPPSELCEAKSLVCESDSIRSRLMRNKRRYEEQLKTVNDALEALDKNPELANLLELVNKAR